MNINGTLKKTRGNGERRDGGESVCVCTRERGKERERMCVSEKESPSLTK